MNRIYKALTTGLLFLASSGVLAEISSGMAQRLMESSGVSQQLSELPKATKAGLAEAMQQGRSVPDDVLKQMLKAVDDSMVPAEMLKPVSASFRKSMNESEAKALLAWYDSDLGKKITAAETEGSTFEAYTQMTAQAETLMADTERVAFAQRLDKLMGATDMAMNMQSTASLAFYSALSTLADPEKPLDLEQAKKEISAAVVQSRPALEQMVVLSYTYAYRNISMEDLGKYERFLTEKSTVKFNDVLIASLDREYNAAIGRFATRFAAILKESRPSGKAPGKEKSGI